MLCHGADYKRADHTRQSAHAVGDAHENTGIARRDVQVIHVEALHKNHSFNISTLQAQIKADLL